MSSLRDYLEDEIASLQKELEEVRLLPDGYLDDYDDDKDIVIANLESDIEDDEKALRDLDIEEDAEGRARAEAEDEAEKRAFSVGFGLSRYC